MDGTARFGMVDRFRTRRTTRVEILERWRRDSEQDSRQSQDQFDKALMTLSAGGIGTTIAFLDKIVPFPQASLKWLLFMIWVFWGTCLLATVFSFYASVRTLARSERQIAGEIDAVRAAPDPDEVPGLANDGGGWNVVTKVLNQAAAILFVLGLIALLIFIWYNLFMTPPKSQDQQINEGKGALVRPSSAIPNTKGLTSTARPTGSGPSPSGSGTSSSSTSGSNAPSGQGKK
jgi:hypothetical protein